MREKRRRAPCIMVDGVFVRALNENRTRGLPLRRRTLYPLSYKGVASFSRLGLTPEPPVSGTTNIESSVEGKPIRRAAAKLLLLVSNQDYGFQRPVCCRYTKEECARTHRTRMPDCVPPCRSNPFLLTGFQALSRGLSLQIGWRMVRESNSPGTSAPTVLAGLRLCRTAHHPCRCLRFRAHRLSLDKPPHGNDFHAGFAE